MLHFYEFDFGDRVECVYENISTVELLDRFADIEKQIGSIKNEISAIKHGL